VNVTTICYNRGGHKIAGHENAGHEFASHEKYRMKIYSITLVCAFLWNFKSFVCKASVLTMLLLMNSYR